MSDGFVPTPVDRPPLKFAVVAPSGDPSPFVELLQSALATAEVESEGLGLVVPSAEFEACVRDLEGQGFRGVLALGSHRVEAARLAEKFFVAKNSMGVANALSFQGNLILAQNTDVAAITSLLQDLPAGRALVLGAGAGARTVIAPLFEMGWKVRLWNRSAMKAKPMLALFARFGKIDLLYQPDPMECNLVINCTPLGAKAGECPPLEWRHVKPKTVFLDLVYRRVPTEFLRNAANRGLPAIDGRNVVIESAALALEWWTGKKIDRASMREAQGVR